MRYTTVAVPALDMVSGIATITGAVCTQPQLGLSVAQADCDSVVDDKMLPKAYSAIKNPVVGIGSSNIY